MYNVEQTYESRAWKQADRNLDGGCPQGGREEGETNVGSVLQSFSKNNDWKKVHVCLQWLLFRSKITVQFLFSFFNFSAFSKFTK